MGTPAHHAARGDKQLWKGTPPSAGHPSLRWFMNLFFIFPPSSLSPPPPPPFPLIHEQASQSSKRGLQPSPAANSLSRELAGERAQLGAGSARSHTQRGTKWSGWTRASRGW